MKYSWEGYKDRNRHKNIIKWSGQAWLAFVKNISRNIPTSWRWARWDERKKKKEIKSEHNTGEEKSTDTAQRTHVAT